MELEFIDNTDKIHHYQVKWNLLNTNTVPLDRAWLEGPANTFSRLCGIDAHRQSVTRLWNSFQFHSISLGSAQLLGLRFSVPPSSSFPAFWDGRTKEKITWYCFLGNSVQGFPSYFRNYVGYCSRSLLSRCHEKGCRSLTQTEELEWKVYSFKTFYPMTFDKFID